MIKLETSNFKEMTGSLSTTLIWSVTIDEEWWYQWWTCFDDEYLGRKARVLSRATPLTENWTPIQSVEVPVCLGKSSKTTASRYHEELLFPREKENGSLKKIWFMLCKWAFHSGQLYAAISRTKSESSVDNDIQVVEVTCGSRISHQEMVLIILQINSDDRWFLSKCQF